MNGEEYQNLDEKITRILVLTMQTREELASIKPVLSSLESSQNRLVSRTDQIENNHSTCPARLREISEDLRAGRSKRRWEVPVMIGGFFLAMLATLPGWLALLSGCSVADDDAAGSRPPVSTPTAVPALLAQMEATARARAVRSHGAATNDPDFDSSTGDAALFDGLLCSVGISESCDSLRASQSADGQFWRSPEWVGKPYGSGSTFSRDMALGVLAGLVATNDKPRMEAWGTYARANDYRLCPDEGNCKLLSPAIWSVFNYAHLTTGAARWGAMRAFRQGHETLAPLARATAPGFQLHLIAVQVYLLSRTSVAKPNTIAVLREKQPLNPFFAYLGRDTANALALTRQWCENPQGARHSWLWERAMPLERPELGSGGWDCLFMVRLLQGF